MSPIRWGEGVYFLGDIFLCSKGVGVGRGQGLGDISPKKSSFVILTLSIICISLFCLNIHTSHFSIT